MKDPTQSIQIVEVDCNPLGLGGDRLSDDYKDLREPFATALWDQVINRPEEARCEECDKGVGFLLDGEDPTYGESLQWHWVTMVALAGPTTAPRHVSLLCEDHTPFIPAEVS